MAKNSKKVAPNFPAFPGNGVLTRTDQPGYAQAVTNADSTSDGIILGLPGYSPVTFPTTDLTQDQSTGRLNFTSANTPYGIRELREDDGQWLSKYKTLLPLPALGALVGPGFSGDQVADPDDDLDTPDESLDAFAMDDSAYIVGVLYTNNAGQYARQDGDWVLLSPDDDTFSDPDLSVIQIDPTKADQFLSMYDQNYISVADAEQYEDPNADSDADTTDYSFLIDPDNDGDDNSGPDVDDTDSDSTDE